MHCSNGLKEDHARFFFQQIIVAIDYCHKMKVSNRCAFLSQALAVDVKPSVNRRLMRALILRGYALSPQAKQGLITEGAPPNLCRDIKLENTLFDSSQKGRNPLIKLCDFGYSINEENSKPKTAVGTPGYTGKTLSIPTGPPDQGRRHLCEAP